MFPGWILFLLFYFIAGVHILLQFMCAAGLAWFVLVKLKACYQIDAFVGQHFS